MERGFENKNFGDYFGFVVSKESENWEKEKEILDYIVRNSIEEDQVDIGK